jgi:hypothetical protein
LHSICLNILCKKEYIKKRSDQNFCSNKCCKKHFYDNNKQLFLQKLKICYRKFKQQRLAKAKEYYILNQDKLKKCKNKYYKKNAEKIKQYVRKWRKENRNITNSYKAKRRALQKKAIPKWSNLKKIKEIYKNCPKGYHVDHIIPINSKLVCGLHVENNLQYLSAKENLNKKNKLLNF